MVVLARLLDAGGEGMRQAREDPGGRA